MEAYSGFAQVYDTFMDNVPYEDWCDYICRILKEHGIEDGLVLDLGCGTGRMTRLLKARGYDMIGIDLSGDMLEVARSGEDEGILYLQQDMREFELFGTVRAIVCLCDSMNYLLEAEELLDVFRLANNYLDPGGIFIFDMNTRYKYENIGDACICEMREEACFVWENYFEDASDINEYVINFFIQREDGLYERTEEIHDQRAYDPELVRELINRSGLQFEACYGEGDYLPPTETSERIYFVARERGKE